MVELADNIATETVVDTLLGRSLKLYQQVEDLYRSMPTDMSPQGVLKVMRTVGTMNALLQDARDIDTRITAALDTGVVLSEATSDMLQRRDALLKGLYRNNRNLTQKAENVKSLLHHEISSLSTGHQAIKGYKQADTERRYIVKESF